jgi:hypothetical protein
MTSAPAAAAAREPARSRIHLALAPGRDPAHPGKSSIPTLRRCACGGSCPRCRGSALRPELAINTPGDAFEREADRMAEAVIGRPAPAVSSAAGSAPLRLRGELPVVKEGEGGGAAPGRRGYGERSRPGAADRAQGARLDRFPGMRLHRCACGGSCPRCRRATPAADALPVSEPGDRWEREAERVAAAAMSACPAPSSAASAPPALRRCACGGSCPSCRHDKEDALHRHDAGGAGSPGFAPPIVHDVLSSPGRPLAAPVRASMEARFGADFGGVRVHDDSRAAESARAVEAHAYAVGRDVVFGAGRYAPGTPAGDRLLAHELAHTLQDDGTARRLHRADFEDGCSGLPSAGGAGCGGTIDVRATTISVAAAAVSHLFIVYTDRAGNAWAFRGGPDGIGGGYGHIKAICGVYDSSFIDYDTAAPSERVYEGDDACTKAQCVHNQLMLVAVMDLPYEAVGANSNSVVGHLLRACGLPVRKPNVSAPGFDLELTPSGPRPNPLVRDRRQRVSLGVAGGLGDLPGPSLGFSYSVDALTALHLLLRFPLRLDARVGTDTGTYLGGASFGIEAPFVNIPLPRARATTSLGLSAGVTGGATRSTVSPGSFDPLLGFQGRVVFGIDIWRIRLDPSYQLEVLQNLHSNQTLTNHILGLHAGLTF